MAETKGSEEKHPNSLSGKSWTKKIARRMLPLLVWCAQGGHRITYGQVDEELKRRRWARHANVVVYGHPAGAIGEACREVGQIRRKKVPPLNAIVVNKRTQVPGNGCDEFLRSYLKPRLSGRLSDVDRKAMAEETIEDVWRFQHWDRFLDLCGIQPLRGNVPILLTRKRPRAPLKRRWSKEGESKEHLALKNWIARNPRILGGQIKYRPGDTEWEFLSADRADVMFEHDKGSLVVEVKSIRSDSHDLERGVYQCVKYRALLNAELKAKAKKPNGSSMLVTEVHLESELRELARLLNVPVKFVPFSRHGR